MQISAYRARVLTPIGNLGQLYALADRIEAELGWSFLHNVQAYQSDGDKTTAFEICEQLGWQAPAAVFVPTGTGTNLFGLWQGFVLFKELGFLDTLPRMFAVQPVGAASLVAPWEAHQAVPTALERIEPNLAPPISHRVSGYHAYKALQESGAGAVAVTDGEVLAAMKDLASSEGIYSDRTVKRSGNFCSKHLAFLCQARWYNTLQRCKACPRRVQEICLAYSSTFSGGSHAVKYRPTPCLTN